ncbi:MOSC domain-containing protein [Alteribacillus sp. HJP-4]|uniref:MOSC domain-containing protein n=1 Tax=Alteribacillus sp. HJP-4 TaxID=2775394 RepID=UPI0035CD09E7
MKLVNLAVGTPQHLSYHGTKKMKTGIQKESVQEVYLSVDGFELDDVADKQHHGGRDRAVCVYPHEHYAFWEKEFGKKLEKAAFGENVTAAGMTEKDVCIGDQFQIGDAVIEVTQSRIPCDTVNKRNKLPQLLKRMIETGYTGFLCRVLKEGYVREESEIEKVFTHPDDIKLSFTHSVYFEHPGAVEAMKEITAVDALAANWRTKLQNRIEKAGMK